MLNTSNLYKVKKIIFVPVWIYIEYLIKMKCHRNVYFIITSLPYTVRINLNYFVLIVSMEVQYIKIIVSFQVRIQFQMWLGIIKKILGFLIKNWIRLKMWILRLKRTRRCWMRSIDLSSSKLTMNLGK